MAATTKGSSTKAVTKVVTKAASWDKAFAMLPSTILKEKTWDQYSEIELLKKMMEAIAYFTGKVANFNYMAGNKGDLILTAGGKTLTRKDIAKLSSKVKEELSKVTPIVMLNITVHEVTFKTPMGLCWVAPELRKFFLGGADFPRVNLGPVYSMKYSPMEQLLIDKIAERRQKLMKERFAKTGLPGAKDRPLETFIPPPEIPKNSESAQHIFNKLEGSDLVAASLIESGWSNHAIISGLLSLYFRSKGLNIKMHPRGKQGEETVRETPKVMFDDPMVASFGKMEYEEEVDDGKRRRKPAQQQGPLFSEADMSKKGIGYLQVIQRITSRCTKKRKNLKGALLADYDRTEANVEFMTKLRDATKAVLESKRYQKEVTELEKRASAKQVE